MENSQEWELTKSGTKRKGSVHNAVLALKQIGFNLYDNWGAKTLASKLMEECKFMPSASALDKAISTFTYEGTNRAAPP